MFLKLQTESICYIICELFYWVGYEGSGKTKSCA